MTELSQPMSIVHNTIKGWFAQIITDFEEVDALPKSSPTAWFAEVWR